MYFPSLSSFPGPPEADALIIIEAESPGVNDEMGDRADPHEAIREFSRLKSARPMLYSRTSERKTVMKEILGCIKRSQQEFHMIQDGDVVAVGLSGGKDSVTLLYALSLYRRFAPVSFDLKAITVDMGFEGFDLKTLAAFCRDIDVEFIPERTRLGEVIFEERKESNPCSLCSRMRRGILHRVCRDAGATKLALGHHGDDLLETFFMSMLYESRVNAFKAVTAFDRTELIQIRPMIYAEESQVREAARRHSLPVVTNPCPADRETKRRETREALEGFLRQTGQPRSHLIRALCRSEIVL